MANNGKNSVTKAQAEAHRRVLQQLLRSDDNRRCADCQARGPTWASVNLGVFVCLNCSGIHRSLGTDLSKVRSTTLDTWLPEQVAFVQRMGNRKANLFWEGRLPRNFKRPTEGDMLGLRYFINDKYRDQRYALQTWDKAPTIETYLVHPFLKDVEGDSASTPIDSTATELASGTDIASRRVQNSSPEPTLRRQSQSSTDVSSIKPTEPPQFRLGSSLRRAPSPLANVSPQPPTVPPATPELFDLLSLNEPESAPSPSVQDVLLPGAPPPSVPAMPKAGHKASLSQESFPDTGSSDGGWAAFVEGAASGGSAQTEEPWDAFQGSAGPDAGTAGRDPFGSQETAATPALQSASFQPKFPSAPPSPTLQPPSPAKTSHRPQKSAEEIMRMFDKPKQHDDLFSAFAQSSGPLPSSFNMPGVGADNLPPPNLWPPFQMPMGAPSHGDLTFPPQMFNTANGFPGGMNAFPEMGTMQGGWATLPPMSTSSFGSSTQDFGKTMR